MYGQHNLLKITLSLHSLENSTNQNHSQSNFSYFNEFHFDSLEGQIDSNPVYDKFNTRHFEINQYTNCDLNHNFQTFNYCFSVYKHELFNYDVKSWK